MKGIRETVMQLEYVVPLQCQQHRPYVRVSQHGERHGLRVPRLGDEEDHEKDGGEMQSVGAFPLVVVEAYTYASIPMITGELTSSGLGKNIFNERARTARWITFGFSELYVSLDRLVSPLAALPQ